MDKIKYKLVDGEPVCNENCPCWSSTNHIPEDCAICERRNPCIPGLRQLRDEALRESEFQREGYEKMRDERDQAMEKAEQLKSEAKKNIRCSFCGKQAREVFALIAGNTDVPVQVYICDECLEVSAELVEDRKLESLKGKES